jgi:hypothetical protein
MSGTATDPQPAAPPATVSAPTVAETAEAAGRLARGWRLRNLARRARAVQLSGDALVGTGLALTVLTAAVLLWAGIVTGAPRAVLLILTAGLLSLRLMVVRLGSMTPADGLAAPAPRNGMVRWLGPVESAVLMAAGGLHAFGSGSDIGPVLGVIAGALVLLVSRRRRTPHAAPEPTKPPPTSLLAVTCLVATLDPLWGWRGQTLLIGLCVISAVLIVQALRAPPPAAG